MQHKVKHLGSGHLAQPYTEIVPVLTCWCGPWHFCSWLWSSSLRYTSRVSACQGQGRGQGGIGASASHSVRVVASLQE